MKVNLRTSIKFGFFQEGTFYILHVQFLITRKMPFYMEWNRLNLIRSLDYLDFKHLHF